ncbi:hypothetical protein H5410_064536 [Solanum commersonii]|uniref:Uncharacterized protein n=1 Tax=Solanum commersonii TaxID=4109 RepID=A0A9J5VZ38_SOLCO|nr:hypothetical protein H5410_064536 [Solanum commersonii]
MVLRVLHFSGGVMAVEGLLRSTMAGTMAEKREINGRGEEKSLMGKGQFFGKRKRMGKEKALGKEKCA